MSALAKKPPRIHPLFPLPTEVQEKPTLAYSDHLPILARVPLPDDTSFNVISLNILSAVKCSGIHPKNSQETEEEAIKRYRQIVQGLIQGIEQHEVDALAFQEAVFEIIVPVLREFLPKSSWEIVEDDFGLVTCFRKDKWELEKTSSDRAHRIRALTLHKNDSELSVNFNNIWGEFDELPRSLEDQCRNALNSTTADVSFIIGDTNSRIAPLDNQPRNIATGAIPIMFNADKGVPENKQISDYPDGGFYKNKEGKIYQLDTQVLDFESGKIFYDNRPEEEVMPWKIDRMVMCLDERLREKHKPIFEYEQTLQKEFNNKEILVRIGADCFNHKTVGISFPANIAQYHYIYDRLKDKPGFQFRSFEGTDSRNRLIPYNSVFAPPDKLGLLQEVIAKSQSLPSPHSWKRDALLGVGIGIIALAVIAISVMTMGVPLAILGAMASIGVVATGLAIATTAIGIVGLASGAAVAIGSLTKNLQPIESPKESQVNPNNAPKAAPVEKKNDPPPKFSSVPEPTVTKNPTPPEDKKENKNEQDNDSTLKP
jgi:hypothetical protein